MSCFYFVGLFDCFQVLAKEEPLVIAYIYSRGGWWLSGLTDLVLSTVSRRGGALARVPGGAAEEVYLRGLLGELQREYACKGSWRSCRGNMLARAPGGAADEVCLQGLLQVVGQGGGQAGRRPRPSRTRAQRSGMWRARWRAWRVWSQSAGSLGLLA